MSFSLIQPLIHLALFNTKLPLPCDSPSFYLSLVCFSRGVLSPSLTTVALSLLSPVNIAGCPFLPQMEVTRTEHSMPAVAWSKQRHEGPLLCPWTILHIYYWRLRRFWGYNSHLIWLLLISLSANVPKLLTWAPVSHVCPVMNLHRSVLHKLAFLCYSKSPHFNSKETPTILMIAFTSDSFALWSCQYFATLVGFRAACFGKPLQTGVNVCFHVTTGILWVSVSKEPVREHHTGILGYRGDQAAFKSKYKWKAIYAARFSQERKRRMSLKYGKI